MKLPTSKKESMEAVPQNDKRESTKEAVPKNRTKLK
jgi:hypothetical protein